MSDQKRFDGPKFTREYMMETFQRFVDTWQHYSDVGNALSADSLASSLAAMGGKRVNGQWVLDLDDISFPEDSDETNE